MREQRNGVLKKKRINIVLIALLVGILILAGSVLWLFISISQGEAVKRVDDAPAKKNVTSEKERDIYLNVSEDMELLELYQEYNSDVVGIIRIDDTVLNHPIVQTVSDEEYYLYKDLDKKYNSHGVPFLSADSLMEGQEGNCIVYGHNIYKVSRDVFADLMGYKELDFYKEHPIVETVSKSGTRRWLIFAYFIVDNADSNPFRYSDVTDFRSKEQFEEYFYEVQKRNWLDVPIDLNIGDTIITLSSCSKELAGTGTNRMVVMAKQLYADETYGHIVKDAQMASAPLLPEKLR